MPPPLPSPPLNNSVSATPHTRAAHGHRSTTSVTQSRNATPKVTSGQGSAGIRSAKVRGCSDKEKGGSGTGPPRNTRRGSAASMLAAREKPPSKDGTAQRHAKEVEGLKDYQLGHCLGKGAFGSVYAALNWSTGETVAIKQIRLSDMPKTELHVIMQEIDLLKNLNHPNIVKYHGFVKSVENLYIILEFCEQGSLHSICKNFGKFPENLVALYTAQVLQGLLFLHEQGVIHRDIKGANILTTKEGLVKLADFGVATNQQGLTEGSVVGTPYWMAPEVIELAGATTASDIWSLGCTVIELLDGNPPYHKFAPMPALFRIVNDDHPPLPEGASPLVRDFLMQCFQKDPNLRVSAKKLLKHPWIVSGKKGNTKKPTEYDEAVKSVQEWNEALKASPPPAHSSHISGRRSSNKTSRPTSRSSAKPGTTGSKPKSESSKPAFRLASRKAQDAGVYASPADDTRRDNWDADFESLTSGIAGLQIPAHLKPQDNFAGLFSSEKLKQYASFDTIPETDGKVEEWDEEFEGDLTVRSTMHLSQGDALETVRPFYPSRTSSDEIKHQPPPPSSLAKRKGSVEKHERKVSRDSQPRTQILRPVQKQSAIPKPTPPKPLIKAPSVVSNKEKYREESEEDYSDLVADDEDAFLKKLARFSPNRPFQPKDLHQMNTKLGGSLRRRRTHTPTQLVHDAAAMRRTRSSLEIQKYAEDDEDEDFTELVFDEQPMNLQTASHKSRSPKSAISGGSESTSERGTLRLTNSVSWDEEEDEEEDDPFAAMEEELDDVDLQLNIARDKHARLCNDVEALVLNLKLGQPEEILADIVEELLMILTESPDVKSVILSSHGMLPMLEILETAVRPHIILRLLKIVNLILLDNIEAQENLCFVGGIPIITRFAHKKYSSDIRLEAAAFVRMMYQTPTLTLQMFVSCGGLNVLVEFLEEDYDAEAGRELVLVGVNGIWSVFELQGPTPKNDFCRIFSRSAVLYPLSLVLNRVLDEEGELAEVVEGRIVNIFLLFSQAENHVKETVADRMVLKRVLKDLHRMSPQHQVTMLKFIKNLSMLTTTLDALQNSNAIEVLTDLLGASMKLPHFRDISNQVLNTMYNLCRLSKARQEDAALSGVVPLLQRIVQTERPLKEFALPILCDMAHSGKVGRKILWQNKGLQFYMGLLADQYWAVTALDAIFIWLQEETAKVEEHLLASNSKFAESILVCFSEIKAEQFENLLEPLQKLLRLSPPVAASLTHRSFFDRASIKLHNKKVLIRLNLLRVMRSICEACEEQGSLLEQYGLLETVKSLEKSDPSILVRNLAEELIRHSNHASATASLGARSAGAPFNAMRRSSSSTHMTPPALITQSSTPGTGFGYERTGSRGGYFDLVTTSHLGSGLPAGSAVRTAMSPIRPVSRDGSSSSSSGVSWSHHKSSTSLDAVNGVAAPRSSGRLPPVSGRMHRPSSRLSLAPSFVARGSETNLASRGSGSGGGSIEMQITPTHIPPSAGTRSSVAVMQRKRRQTSNADFSGR